MSSGSIVQIIGAVIDVEFPRDSVPKVYDALLVEAKNLTLEVQQQLGDGIVRTIAMGSSEGVSRGLAVSNTNAPVSVPVGTETLGRIMDVLGNPIDEAGPIGEQDRMPIHRKACGASDVRYYQGWLNQVITCCGRAVLQSSWIPDGRKPVGYTTTHEAVTLMKSPCPTSLIVIVMFSTARALTSARRST